MGGTEIFEGSFRAAGRRLMTNGLIYELRKRNTQIAKLEAGLVGCKM
jgi:hypothetical protein